MRVNRRIIAMVVAFSVIFPAAFIGQVDPSLTIYDSQGIPFTSQDNSTVFTASPGALFLMEVAGAPIAPFGLFLSMKTTPFPTNIVPPPLFIMPPILPVIAGPNAILNPSGHLTFTGVVPSDFLGLGYDINLYFQAFVQDPVNGFQLTNGIRMEIIDSEYTADLALGQGDALNQITVFGRLQDPEVGDNKEPSGGGKGLLNGESIVPDPDITPSTYGFKDDVPPPEFTPIPANSIYLNGKFPLVPGDAGFDDRFLLHAMLGSSPYIYTRDRICRNNENENLQHIIVPVFDSDGNKTHDMNVYHFRDVSTGEFGFMVLDVQSNDFYELKGTRLKSNNTATSASPWDAHVAISPDGKYMAAVHKDRVGDYINVVEDLYVIKLQENDTWSTGFHARKVQLNDPKEPNFKETRIFAETLTFAGEGTGYPYTLFFATNKYNSLAGDPMNMQPPIEHPSVLWSVNPNGENAKGVLHKFNDAAFPLTQGDRYMINYYGLPAEYSGDGFRNLNELVWLASENHSTICMRAAGRYSEWDSMNKEWNPLGDWSWEILSITNITGPSSFTLTNITEFTEQGDQQGFYIAPFGHATNGYSKAAINPEGDRFVFVGKSSSTLLKSNIEELYYTPTDGSMAGVLYDQPLTSTHTFKGDFQPPSSDPRGREVLDPYFINNDDLLFFCGKGANYYIPYFPPKMDLFLYRDFYGEFRNLTNTAGEILPDPPVFTEFGDIRPVGVFSSRDGRYVFFFRGHSWDFFPIQTVNLVGIDTANDFRLFDLTGGEFSSGFIPDLAGIIRSAVVLGTETMNLILVPTENTELLFFTAMYDEHRFAKSHQVLMVNMDFPVTAIPVTSFDVNETGIIDNLVADSTGNYIAFSRSNKGDLKGTEGAFEKIYVVDLSHGAYMRDLTIKFPDYDRASIDGSFRFLPTPSPETPRELIYGMGQGGNKQFADNPPNARIWLYPLEGVSDPAKPFKAYPLTEKGVLLMFNALPY